MICARSAYQGGEYVTARTSMSVEDIDPIPGTTKLERFEENIEAVVLQLTPDDLRKINSAAANITVQGARYPEYLQQRVGR